MAGARPQSSVVKVEIPIAKNSALGFKAGVRFQQDGVNRTEDHSCCTDPQREGQNGQASEAEIFSEGSQSEAQVLPQPV